MSAFAGGPLTAIVGRDGTLGVVATNIDEAAARASAADHVTVYRGLEPARPHARGVALPAGDGRGAGRARRRRHRRSAGRRRCPWTVAELLARSAAPSWSRSTPSSTRQRMTKTALEIERLRRCAHLTDLGQAAALRGSRPGRTELEVWTEIRLRDRVGGGYARADPGDYVSGIDRTAAVGGFPTDRASRPATRSCATSRPARTATGATRATRSSSVTLRPATSVYEATEAAVQAAVEHLRRA